MQKTQNEGVIPQHIPDGVNTHNTPETHKEMKNVLP